MTAEEMTGIAAGFSRIAQSRGFELASCAEEIDLDAYGLAHGACLDKKHLERVIGTRLELGQDANQRQACLCVEAVDLGVYNTCPHGCAYCYAVSSRKTAEKRLLAHDPAAPMLTGHPSGAEIVTERTQGSHKARQFSLFGS
jgi:hypothetical protein